MSRHLRLLFGSIALTNMLILCGAVVVRGQGGTGRDVPKTSPRPPKKATTIKPEPPSTVIASGEIRPLGFVSLKSEVAGRIQKIYVNVGDQVTKNQALALIEVSQETLSAAKQIAQNARDARSSAQQALVVAETVVAEAKQDAVIAEGDLRTSEREFRRSKDLVEKSVMSQSEYNDARGRYDQAKAKSEARNLALNGAEEKANQQRAAVKAAQTSVDYSEKLVNQLEALLRGQSSQREEATLKSPLNGVVADILTRVGEVTPSGLSSGPLMTIADMSTITVEVRVDAKEISRVKVGQQATIGVDAFHEKEIRGVVTRKSPIGVAKSDTESGPSNEVNVQNVKDYKVTVELREMSDKIRNALRPGMSATATITIKRKSK